MRFPLIWLVPVVVLTACEGSNPTSPGAQPEAPAANRGPSERQPAAAGKGAADMPACTDRPVFDALPIALEDFSGVRPLGFLAPGQVLPARSSAFARAEGKSRAAVRFPGAARVTSIVEQTNPKGEHRFSVSFAPCRELSAWLGNLGSVSTGLAAEMAKVTPTCQDLDAGAGTVHKCEFALKVEVKSGDAMGESDDSPALEFGILDFRTKPPAFVEPAHYHRDWLLAVSPLSYFAPPVRASLEAKLGSDDGRVKRSAEPKLGTHVQDLAGTAQGNWFPPEKNLANTSDTASFLALVHDPLDPSQPLLSAGGSVPGLPPGLYSFTPERSGSRNRDFADVKPDSGVQCYDGFAAGRAKSGLRLSEFSGAVLLAMPDARTLRMERVAGKRCADLGAAQLSDTAVSFER